MILRSLLSALVALLACCIPLSAQDGFTVEGRVLEAGTDREVPFAVIELEGHGSTITGLDGRYRFGAVEPGGYQLSVTALGFAPEIRSVAVVDTGLDIEVELRPAPILLDTLAVDARTIDLRGRVRDAESAAGILDARILTNLGRGAATDALGAFVVEDVFAEVPLNLSVRAFGYLPLDHVFVPVQGIVYTMELRPDPVVQAMLDEAVGALEERASGWQPAMMPSMSREELLPFDNATVLDVLETEYRATNGRVACVVIDERQTYTPEADLLRLVPEEIQRIEFMYLDPAIGGDVMLRVYTRDFMRDMVAGGVELGRPVSAAAPLQVGRDQRDPPDDITSAAWWQPPPGPPPLCG